MASSCRGMASGMAAVFAAGTLATAAHAQGTNKCYGINACKGQSACNSYKTSCKGKNACKGKGFEQMTEKACIEKVGRG